jgi:hypothetical protein
MLWVAPTMYVLCRVFHDDGLNTAKITSAHISDEFKSKFIKLDMFGVSVFSDCL